MSTIERRLLAREAAISAAVAATLTGLIVWLGPPGVDLAAHAYQRTFLLEHGFALWNNFWYGGRYSFVTYSFLYYPLAAVIGIKVLAVATISAAALAFTLVVWQEWGSTARFSSRTFAVLWAGIALSAAFPFALGAALALLAMNALQKDRPRIFAGLVFLTLLASPLAFLLLALILAGSSLQGRPRRATVVVVAAAGVLELVLRRLFPGGGHFPFSVADFVPGVAFAVLGILVTARVPRARRLLGLFAVFLAAILLAFAIPSDLGSNVERLKFAAIPIALLAAALTAPRRIVLAIALVGVAGFWNISALAHTAKTSTADPAHTTAYWAPAIRYLHAHLSPSYRVEAVDTAEHWAAAYLPDAGIPIVRGWYRQSDFPQNELLYDKTLNANAYEAWLRSQGVRYVLLPDARPDYSALNEAVLIRSGKTSLVPVFRSAHIVVYQLPYATPLITGAGDASVVWMYPTHVVALVDAKGRYKVRVRWSPYWRASSGCVWRGPDGMLRLLAARPGLVDLSVSVDVKRGLETLTGLTPRRVCSS
ncbi:MAG TPA: hypothetical protein VH108_11030 [Gaiellaceae bacterium]|nr:hypothetical protein [Gaiellaceae bacterium]